MQEWLEIVTRGTVLIIDAMALIVIAIGTVEGFVGALRVMLRPQSTNHEKRMIWLRYGRWLVAGLTFQLAADIIETSFAPSWEEVGRLGAIAAIRTFLDYFLERDLAEVRERDRDAGGAARDSPREAAREYAPPSSRAR